MPFKKDTGVESQTNTVLCVTTTGNLHMKGIISKDCIRIKALSRYELY